MRKGRQKANSWEPLKVVINSASLMTCSSILGRGIMYFEPSQKLNLGFLL